jgi:hypothetical protein
MAASASEHDGEARWSGHQKRKAIHGYKAHPALGSVGNFVCGRS